MKKILLSLLFTIACSMLHAQWTPLTSGTTQNLNDVSFLNPDYGIAGADSGFIIITTDGGMNWSPPVMIGIPGDVGAVHIINQDTFLVSVIDNNSIPHLSYSANGGLYWQEIGVDSFCYRPLDTDALIGGKWFTSGSSIITSDNQGASWDTLLQSTCSTNSIDRMQVYDSQVINAGGLLAGFTTYSASMIRSENGGISFHGCDPTSFLNSDALTAFHFPHADTGMIFMNQYNGFMPGTVNSLIKTYNYTPITPFPPDTLFSFTSVFVNQNIPGWVNDAYFANSNTGFAAFATGWIYETNNGGQNWFGTYNASGQSLNRLAFPDESTGYAVGNLGTIIKYVEPVSIEKITGKHITLFPNPASEVLNISGLSKGNYQFSIVDIRGSVLKTGKTDGNSIMVNDIAQGTYILEISEGENSVRVLFRKVNN